MIIGFFVLRIKAYKYPAIVLRESGEEDDDYIVLQDKVKVSWDKEQKLRVIYFKSNVGQKSLMPQFKHWTKFYKGSADEYEQKFITMEDKSFRKRFQQGLIFFQTGDGEVKPCKLTKGELSVLDQDNRNFLVEDLRLQQRFITSNKDKIINALLMGGTIVIVGVVLMFFIVYFDKIMSHNIAAVCQGVKEAGNTNIIQGIVGG